MIRSHDLSLVRRLLPLLLAVVIPATLSGCVLVPFIQAFKEVGATEGDRMALLDK